MTTGEHLVIEVDHSFHRPAPPMDPIVVVQPYGWDTFATSHATGWVMQWPHRRGYLLHWIESRKRPHGTAVLWAICEWADEMGLTGYLTCEPKLTKFYERAGWEAMGTFGDRMIRMERTPKEDT
jgi:hypothetical protein